MSLVLSQTKRTSLTHILPFPFSLSQFSIIYFNPIEPSSRAPKYLTFGAFWDTNAVLTSSIPCTYYSALVLPSAGSSLAFSLNNFSARAQTPSSPLISSTFKLGSSSVEKASLASLATRLGRWSILTVVNASPSPFTFTGTVGLKNVLISR